MMTDHGLVDPNKHNKNSQEATGSNGQMLQHYHHNHELPEQVKMCFYPMPLLKKIFLSVKIIIKDTDNIPRLINK